MINKWAIIRKKNFFLYEVVLQNEVTLFDGTYISQWALNFRPMNFLPYGLHTPANLVTLWPMDYLGWVELFPIGSTPANRLHVRSGWAGPVVVVNLPAVKMEQDPALQKAKTNSHEEMANLI